MSKETNRIPGSLSRNLSLASVIGGLYGVLVVALAPISFLPFQVRFADALMPLAILFGWPAVLGITVGAAVGNLAGGLLGISGTSGGGIGIDTIGGSIANLLAGLVAWKVGNALWTNRRNRWFVATLLETLIVSVIVGSYLSVLFPQAVEVSILLVAAGSVVAINLVGNLVLSALGRQQTLEWLRSRGLLPESASKLGRR